MDRMHIEITGMPKPEGDEPDEIRQAWVGEVLPAKMSFPGVFEVDAMDAIDILEFSSPEAAGHWKKEKKPGDVFIFTWLCCEVVAAPDYKRVPSIP